MSATIKIGSSGQWSQVLGSSSIVVADFYADWCGPCKQIAPTFESLSTKFSKPKKISFCKIDVDSQGDVAKMYNVRAMPTFLILRNGTVIDTIQGANPPALTAAVEKAVKLAGPGGGQTFTAGGHRLGGTGVGGSSSGTLGQPLRWDLNNFVNMVISFIGIYLVSLLSLDPYMAAQTSQYNKNNPARSAKTGTGGTGAAAKKNAARPTFRTLADFDE